MTRDTDATPFAVILEALLRRVPGAFGAALVDAEGESVDYAGVVEAFDIRVAAAHAQILVAELARFGHLGVPRWLIVRAEKKSIVVRVLPDHYALVVLLRRRAGFAASARAYAACERDLAREAGWAPPGARNAERGGLASEWYPVDVLSDRLGRPRKVGGLAVRVLGAFADRPRGENGYRVRTEDGNEISVIRESRRCWYADTPVAQS